nr:RNA-directed DNA polymerase, eukaryota [Tanacetum cinerariifolium]
MTNVHQRRLYAFNEDHIKKISHSIYVTNFLDSASSRDLWRACNTYGTVVDVYIPLKKSQIGKRFAFVRFIKVFNLDRLVKNLYTIWIGNHHLYAKQVRFERPHKPVFSFSTGKAKISGQGQSIPGHSTSKGHTRSYANAVNGIPSFANSSSLISSSPALVLDDNCLIERDFSKYAMGRVKDVHSISNIMSILHDEGFVDVKPKRINYSKVEGVPETIYKVNSISDQGYIREPDKQIFEDPFGIYNILHKNQPHGEIKAPSSSLSHHLGFTPVDLAAKTGNVHSNEVVNEIPASMNSPLIDVEVVNSPQEVHMETKREWVKELSVKNKLNFIAIQKTKMDKISHMEVKFMWGNSNYDFVCSDSLGNSGGILCIWEATAFKKDYVTILDNFVAIYGTWIPSNVKILIVAIYAPQQLTDKHDLWEYLLILIGHWKGETILMGDINEVRSREERRGSVFNPSGARVFNHFIDSLGLVDVKLEGYSFTWSHPSATKMSKLDRFLVSDGVISLFPSISAICLDRRLSDHRPILLHDVQVDFGSTPFCFYHSWFCYEGFDEMVEQSWRAFSHSDRNVMIRFKKKLQDLTIIIKQWIKVKRDQLSRSKQNICIELSNIDKELDSGTVSDTCLARRCALIGQLHDIKKKEAADYFQKSKAFHNHFASRFKIPAFLGIKINFPFPNRLSSDHATDIERDVSRDEIREAVWNCRDNKSPGPDGYSFEFFKKYWGFIGLNFCEAVDHFFAKGAFSKGCNSLFIALIPKVKDAKLVNDFRPISLIGCVYKAVTKILANRLPLIISNIVSNTQSAFVSERQILDGPFIINELLHWCKREHEKAMFFKVDFAKAYDSVRWDYLIDVLGAFWFGSKWCQWIRGTFCFAKASILVNGSPSNEFNFHCRLKQGDPLASLLFILVMESLYLSISRVAEARLFKGNKRKNIDEDEEELERENKQKNKRWLYSHT